MRKAKVHVYGGRHSLPEVPRATTVDARRCEHEGIDRETAMWSATMTTATMMTGGNRWSTRLHDLRTSANAFLYQARLPDLLVSKRHGRR
jgi:hypothetical protein